MDYAGDSSDASIEATYQKKTPLEHILLRPDTYVGSIEMQESKLWVWNEEASNMEFRNINYVPGLYKIFDELLVNAADNYQRDRTMNKIQLTIDRDSSSISVWNNGKGIPVVMHQEYNIYVPELIFGHLLTSSNYDDSKRKVTGGRNGYGAKLANVFSKRFIVETADSERMLRFRMEWTDNMSRHSEPTITKLTRKENYTCVTFFPDLARLGMRQLDNDIVSLMYKRAYDLAGCTGRNVKVVLNGKQLEVKNFSAYVDLYLGGKSLPKLYETVNSRWEVAVSVSDGIFQQVSFVNSICTSKGGTHVTHVTEQLVSAIQGLIEKKHKKLEVKTSQIKQHIWVFVNCLVENPCFDSQTKENMTLKPSAFGSKCELSESMIKNFLNCGIIDHVVAYANAKNQAQLGAKVKAKKTAKIFVPKLEDANDAGTKKSRDCTIILTEGDSAKALAMAGIEIIGRDKYGVFPLRGKLLNVREASAKQLMNNEEIQAIMKILGIQPNKTYDDLDALRYGSVMIMTDQDMDGSHIKGLIINFLHFFWPNLIKRGGFVKEFITPIVKCKKGNRIETFYTLPEYEQWKRSIPDPSRWDVKYYKGLGTSSNKEAQEYFSNLVRHKIDFFWEDDALDGDAIDLAFNKKRANDRKRWLATLEPDTFLDQNIDRLAYHEFVNKELILYSNHDNIRSIPSVVDGLKPGHRKILYCCFKRKLQREIKVLQLCGYVAEHSAYHSGEQNLGNTIVGLAQNFVGSNNINLLLPNGQFGTRNMGGKDSASTRYIFTQLANVTRKLFIPEDDLLLTYQFEDDCRIEPHYYVPVIPLVLINGAEGIGTGWSTNVPPFNPIDLIQAIKAKLDGAEFSSMQIHPWFKGFTGTIEYSSRSKSYEIRGVMERTDSDWLKITELPINKWTSDYKTFLEEIVISESNWITEFKEYHTENRVHFELKIPNLSGYSDADLFKNLKLVTSLTIGNMVLFDSNRKIKKYNDIFEIMEEFFELRLDYYHRRKVLMVSKYTKEVEIISNKVRFILEVIAGTFVIGNVKRRILVGELQRRGYATKTQLDKIFAEMSIYSSAEESTEKEADEIDLEVAASNKDYEYLLGMPLWSLTYEKVEELKRDQADKSHKLKILVATSEEKLWVQDLDNLHNCIIETWECEERDRNNTVKVKPARNYKPKQARKPKDKENQVTENTKPAPRAAKAVAKLVEKPEAVKQTKLTSFIDAESESEPDLMTRLMAKNPKLKPPLITKSMTDESEVSDNDSAVSSQSKSRKRKQAKSKEPAKKKVKRTLMAVAEIDSDYEI